jgi:hypothetical protein
MTIKLDQEQWVTISANEGSREVMVTLPSGRVEFLGLWEATWLVFCLAWRGRVGIAFDAGLGVQDIPPRKPKEGSHVRA